jgi:hypothetical protein
MTLRGQAVDFAHLGGGEDFHELIDRIADTSKAPAKVRGRYMRPHLTSREH